MSEVCTCDGCKSTSCQFCYYSNNKFSPEDSNENNEETNYQLNPLIDEINTLNAHLITLNIDQLTENSREKLDQWREHCFLLINEFYERKCQEINKRYNKRIHLIQDEINQTRSKITNLTNEQYINNEDIEILSLNIDDIKRKVKQIKEQLVEIDIYPLKLDENLISIEETKIYQFDLSKISKPFKIINCTEQSWSSMISNENFFLIDQYPNLILFNKDFQIVKQIPWLYGFIRNMSWSSTLLSFIIINNQKEIYLLQQNSLTIERLQTSIEQYWWSSTCSDEYLYLTNATMGTNIFQFNFLSSTVQLIKKWKSPQSCKQHEYIDDICYNNGKLALIIKISSKNIVYLDIRSATTLDRFWIIQLDIRRNWFQQTIRCCSINYDDWLVIEGNTSHLFHILKNGKLKTMGEYLPAPINALLFRPNILLIRTKQSIIFHGL